MNKEKLVIIDAAELQELIESSIQKVLNKQSRAEEANQQSYLNVEAASAYLKIAKQTLYGLTSKKAIPYIKRNKKLYFLEVELRSWLEEGRKIEPLTNCNINLLKHKPIKSTKKNNTS